MSSKAPLSPDLPPNDLGPLVTEFIENTLGMILHRPSIVLQVAIDGSGSVLDDRFVAYGTVAGLEHQWNFLGDNWRDFLNRRELSHLRMADAMSWRGPFEAKHHEWGEKRDEVRDQVLTEAAQIIALGRPHGVKIAASSADLHLGNLPSEKIFRYRKKLLFTYVVQQLLADHPDEYVLFLLCDDEQDVAIDFYKFLDAFKRTYPNLSRRIGGIGFYDDRRVGQLQAADMVAYVSRHEREGRLSHLSAILFPEGTTTRDDEVSF